MLMKVRLTTVQALTLSMFQRVRFCAHVIYHGTIIMVMKVPLQYNTVVSDVHVNDMRTYHFCMPSFATKTDITSYLPAQSRRLELCANEVDKMGTASGPGDFNLLLKSLKFLPP